MCGEESGAGAARAWEFLIVAVQVEALLQSGKRKLERSVSVQAFRVFISRRPALDLSVESRRASAGPGAPSLGLSPQPVPAPHIATRESHVAKIWDAYVPPFELLPKEGRGVKNLNLNKLVAHRFVISASGKAMMRTLKNLRNPTRNIFLAGRCMTVQATKSHAVPLGLEHGTDVKPGIFRIKTFNKISEKGLQKFPADLYQVTGEDDPHSHAILLRRC
jgi:hypothetical protein